MERFIRRQNLLRYRQLLEAVADEDGRQRILRLLEEEKQKQKDAGDKDSPLRPPQSSAVAAAAPYQSGKKTCVRLPWPNPSRRGNVGDR